MGAKFNNAFIGSVDAGISPENNLKNNDIIPPVIIQQLIFTDENPQEFRFSVPFTAERLILVLQNKNNELKMNIKVQ